MTLHILSQIYICLTCSNWRCRLSLQQVLFALLVSWKGFQGFCKSSFRAAQCETNLVVFEQMSEYRVCVSETSGKIFKKLCVGHIRTFLSEFNFCSHWSICSAVLYMLFKFTLIHLFTHKWFIVQKIVYDITYTMLIGNIFLYGECVIRSDVICLSLQYSAGRSRSEHVNYT
jgi:hypothetical protein